MATAKTGLFAVSYLAVRKVGATQDIQHGLEIVQATSEAAALKTAKAFALLSLHPLKGWMGHHFVVRPVTSVLKPQAEWKP